MFRKVLLAVALIALLPLEAFSEEVSLGGFLQGDYSFDTETSNPDGGDMKWSEERFQLKLDRPGEPVRLFLKADVFFDNIDGKADVEVREAYFDLAREKWDLRVGRQIITWGLGDLIFINDVFPKDYEAFFSGRPLEYLKKGVDGVKIGLYPEIASIEAVVIPFFEPNNFPNPNRFWMFDPLSSVTNRVEDEPSSAEVALRAYRDVAGFDTSLYLYRGFYRQFSMFPDSLSEPARITLKYPELSVYGLSLQRSIASGVLSLEGGYYDSREDRDGVDPLIPNSQTKVLVGYQRQIIEDFTVGLQYLGEYMDDYGEYEANLPSGFLKEARYRQLTSLRLTYLLMHQNLKLSWFSFWSPSDKDYLLNPEAKYNFTDHAWAAIGLNVFGGDRDTTQFGSLDENDNVYVQARYEF